MSRPVSMRASYGPDAAFLLRLQVAVKKDPRRRTAWLKEVQRCLNRLSTLFLEAECEDLNGTGQAAGEAATGAKTGKRRARTKSAASAVSESDESAA